MNPLLYGNSYRHKYLRISQNQLTLAKDLNKPLIPFKIRRNRTQFCARSLIRAAQALLIINLN